MSRFLTKPTLKRVVALKQTLFCLTSDLIYEIGPEDSGENIIVPSGRFTNLATIPRTPFLIWLYHDIASPDGRYIAAPILHDYLCNEDFPGNPEEPSGFTRFEAAALFRSALRSLGAPRWQSFTAYAAVRLNDAWVWLKGLRK